MIDQVIARLGSVEIGVFRCAPDDPGFRDSGPTQHHLVVFPRRPVWIRHGGATPFLADPTIATVYNQGQEYTRHPAHPDGDRCEWFALEPQLAVAILEGQDPGVRDHPDRPFGRPWVPASLDLYLRQRRLVSRLRQSRIDPAAAEEEALAIVGEALHPQGREEARRGTRSPARASQRELVDRVKAAIARDPTARPTVAAMAEQSGVSPFHLCRVFRSTTGTTMHQYRLDLRLRLALERLAESDHDLSRLAFELGFSSHSHFTATLRRVLATTPRALRNALAQRGNGDLKRNASRAGAGTPRFRPEHRPAGSPLRV